MRKKKLSKIRHKPLASAQRDAADRQVIQAIQTEWQTFTVTLGDRRAVTFNPPPANVFARCSKYKTEPYPSAQRIGLPQALHLFYFVAENSVPYTQRAILREPRTLATLVGCGAVEIMVNSAYRIVKKLRG